MYKVYKKAQIAEIRPIMAIVGEDITDVKKRTGCDCIFNGGIYTFSDRSIDSQVRIDGKNYGKYTTFGFAIDNKNNVYWDSGLTNKKAPHFIGEYGILIENGKIVNTLKDSNRNTVTKRTALGIKASGDVIVMLATGKESCNLYTLCERMLKLGCVYAINLDGGGSTQGIFEDGTRYISGREVVWYVGIWLNKKTSTTTATTTNKTEVKKEMKIAIDCGHTASTAGKRSPDGTLREYEFNRDVGKRLEKHLKRHGLSTLLIAPVGDDDLMGRCETANEWGADYFISIHANAFENTWNAANGWSIFVVSRGGQAEKLAKAIYAESVPYLGLKDRIKSQGGGKILTEPFIVLKHTDMPAVLVEHGFYTNLQECERLKTSEFREMCAIADAKGILRHLGIKWKEETKGEWYDEACAWVKENGIADGTRPTENVTRAEVFTMLQRLFDKLAK